jgi:hypothetical protein
MNLTAKERAVIGDLFPFPIRGIPDSELDEILDAWFVHDHYDDNPAYTADANESGADA